jgi:predicted RNA-binding Zn-ribbon protein involved in translation (DUF1610 family)
MKVMIMRVHIKELRKRRTVNTCFWNSSYSGPKKPKCDICQQSLVTPAGQKDMQCPKCGKVTTIEDVKKTQEKKLVNTNPKTAGPVLISQKRKGKCDKPISKYDSVNEQLDEEDKADIRAADGTI